MSNNRVAVRLELAETSHKIKSAKMRSRAEMKLAMQLLERQRKITRTSSDMQQALVRQHLEDLLLVSKGFTAPGAESGRTTHRTAHPAFNGRLRDKPIVAPSLTEEYAFRERLLKRLQLLQYMRQPSNYSKRLLSEDEQEENVAMPSNGGDGGGGGGGSGNGDSKVRSFQRGIGRSVKSGRGSSLSAAATRSSESRGKSAGTALITDDKTEKLRASTAACRKEDRMPTPLSCSRAGLPSKNAETSPETCAAADADDLRRVVPGTPKGSVGSPLMTERQTRFYDSLRGLRRLSTRDLIGGLRCQSSPPRRVLADGDDETTLIGECRDIVGFCRKASSSLTWKPIIKAN